MDRDRYGSPYMSRQRSSNSVPGSESPSHPAAAGRHVRSGSAGVASVRRPQNTPARAAAARLAQAMASRTLDDEDDDDLDNDDNDNNQFAFPSRLGAAARARAPSPQFGRNPSDSIAGALRSTSTGRPSVTRPPAAPSAQTAVASSRPRVPTPVIVPQSPLEIDVSRFGRLSSSLHDDKRETASLHDKIDQLEEEKEELTDQLHITEDKWKEAEARVKELEKQVASLGEGISLEARLLTRKEAAIKQREAALMAAKQSKDGKDDEIAALRLEVEAARDEAASAVEQARNAEGEARSLRTMTQRMILTQEEMEEVVLKRCWLARYWGLCVQYGIHAEIAGPKHEYWSSFAPIPLEYVLSASQKEKEDSTQQNGTLGAKSERRVKSIRDLTDITAEGNIESMLSVEKGLRELASLKVEDAIMLAMAQQKRPGPVRVGHVYADSASLKGMDTSRLLDSFELSPQEVEDVQFKQAWLVYFWRRAKNSGVEEDIADERLHHWISRSSQSSTFQDAVDVDRGLLELRRLGIENQLWEACRKEMQEASNVKATVVADADGPSS